MSTSLLGDEGSVEMGGQVALPCFKNFMFVLLSFTNSIDCVVSLLLLFSVEGSIVPKLGANTSQVTRSFAGVLFSASGGITRALYS